MKRFIALAFLLNLILTACEKDDGEIIVPEVLEESELIKSFTIEELASFIEDARLPIQSRDIKYDVDIYKITYLTKYKTEEIIASGLVILPRTNDRLTLLSFQHGTIAAHSEAPTETEPEAGIMKFYAALATPGFVGVIPDFIGFGSSKQILHPYYIEQATADAVIDNIRAARELALVNKKNLSNRLLLAGYSQGGYATMAAHKKIEEDGGTIDNLELIASYPASGGYDVKGVQEYFFGLETYDQPFFMAYVAASYKQTYDWDRDLSFFFNEPYASLVPELFDGSKSGSDINEALTNNITDLIQADFIENIDTNPEYKFIVDAFNENSLTDWTPTIPLYMYHGDSDTTVPYINSVETYNNFIQNGASPSIVTFTSLPFATHSTGVTPYIIELINKVLAQR